MSEKKVVKFVGNMVFAAAVCLVCAGISYIFVPYEQKLILFSNEYFVAFKENPFPYFGFWSFMLMQASVMIGIISYFYYLDEHLKTPLFKWISKLATFGFLIMGLTYISRLYYMPKVTNEYLQGSDIVKEVVIAGGTMEFDKFLMSFGFATIWFFTTAVYSVKYKIFPVWVRLLTFLCAIGYCVGLVGYFVEERVLTTSSSVLVIFFPVWAWGVHRYCKKKIATDNK